MPMYPDPYMMENSMVMILPFLSSVIPSSLVAVATYVLTALALYTIAGRRGIAKPWLSWVPVVNVWVIGSLSDQYRYVVKGQICSKRKVLLVLNLVNAVMGLILLILGICAVVELVGGSMYGMREQELVGMILGSLLGAAGLGLVISGIAIAAAVIRYICIYDVYRSLDPDNSLMFLILSILFHVTEPFFLFFSRNRDDGMPPRKQPPVQEVPQWDPRKPEAEPWETEPKEYV